jgi:hypothetical protein
MFLGLPDPDPDPLVRGTDRDPADLELDPDPEAEVRIRASGSVPTKVTRIPNTAYVKLTFFVHIVALCGQAAATIIMKHENRLLGAKNQ